MENFKVEWEHNGRRVRSVVSYSRGAAEDRKAQLEEQGLEGVEVVEVPVFGA